MPIKPFYIQAFDQTSGLNQYLEPFLIPEKAYKEMRNFAVYRGRIQRKPGSTFLGRLRRGLTVVSLANTTGGNPYTVADILGSASSFFRPIETNAEIVMGGTIIRIDVGGANQTIYQDSVTPGILTYISGPYTGSGTINYLTGAISITFTVVPPAGLTVNYDSAYYPNLPCMGLKTRQVNTAINQESLLAFDRRYSYVFTSGVFSRLPAASVPFWQGTDSDFFWTVDYWNIGINTLTWITNFNKGATPDPIRYFDGTTTVVVNPQIDTAGTPNRLQQARCILPYKGRLLMLNTWEGTTLAAATNFPQRIRWSQVGDPTSLTTSWLSDTSGRGGFLDLPTSEQIVSCEYIKDVLLVKCESSSWKLTFTGDLVVPFIAQRINQEFGAESTFSLVPFDRGILGIGNAGLTADDGVNVERIDEVIPDFIFRINNDNNGVKRVQGIRDYTAQYVYWNYPRASTNATFPDAVLAYNYVSQNYSFYDASYTALGYYQPTADVTWASLPYLSWSGWEDPWNSGALQSGYPQVIAGNQSGGVVVLDTGIRDAPSLAVSNITGSTTVTVTVQNHNLQNGYFVYFSGIVSNNSGATNFLNGPIYRVTVLSANTFTLQSYNSTTQTFQNVTITGSYTYLGGGLMALCPKPSLTSKFFCPFYEQANQMSVTRLDLLMDRTSNGEMTVNIYVDENGNDSVNDPSDPNNQGLSGDNSVPTTGSSLFPYQATQAKIWQTLFFNEVCQNFQYQITLDDAQMSSLSTFPSEIVLHATCFYAEPVGRLAP